MTPGPRMNFPLTGSGVAAVAPICSAPPTVAAVTQWVPISRTTPTIDEEAIAVAMFAPAPSVAVNPSVIVVAADASVAMVSFAYSKLTWIRPPVIVNIDVSDCATSDDVRKTEKPVDARRTCWFWMLVGITAPPTGETQAPDARRGPSGRRPWWRPP